MNERPGAMQADFIGTVVVLVLLELVLGGQLSFFGATPHFLFAVTCCFAYRLGSSRGAMAGFVCGLFADLLGSGTVGISALLLTIVGYALGILLSSRVSLGGARSAIALGCAALFYNLAYLALASAFGSLAGPASTFVGRIVVSSILDYAIALLAIAVLARLSVRRDRLSTGLH